MHLVPKDKVVLICLIWPLTPHKRVASFFLLYTGHAIETMFWFFFVLFLFCQLSVLNCKVFLGGMRVGCEW